MRYMVLTSDGEVHETDDAKQFVTDLDELDVIDYGAPADEWSDLAKAFADRHVPEPLDEDTRNALLQRRRAS